MEENIENKEDTLLFPKLLACDPFIYKSLILRYLFSFISHEKEFDGNEESKINSLIEHLNKLMLERKEDNNEENTKSTNEFSNEKIEDIKEEDPIKKVKIGGYTNSPNLMLSSSSLSASVNEIKTGGCTDPFDSPRESSHSIESNTFNDQPETSIDKLRSSRYCIPSISSNPLGGSDMFCYSIENDDDRNTGGSTNHFESSHSIPSDLCDKAQEDIVKIGGYTGTQNPSSSPNKLAIVPKYFKNDNYQPLKINAENNEEVSSSSETIQFEYNKQVDDTVLPHLFNVSLNSFHENLEKLQQKKGKNLSSTLSYHKEISKICNNFISNYFHSFFYFILKPLQIGDSSHFGKTIIREYGLPFEEKSIKPINQKGILGGEKCKNYLFV